MDYNRLTERRKELGLTLEEVAEKVEVSKSTVLRWESGAIENMKRNKIASLAKVLKVTPFFIMGMEEEEIEEPGYYLNDETSKMAQEIFENKELRALFSASRKAKPEDLKLVHDMLLRMKRSENYEE